MQTLHGLALIARLVGRALMLGRPAAIPTAQRLRNIRLTVAPLERPVEIRWNEYQVPSIAAQSERDLAAALGIVHAHLRLAQMEIMRRLAQARIAETIGPAGIPIDHALRLMRIDAAIPEIVAMLPEGSRQWAEAFVAGVNHHIAGSPSLPYEFRLLGLRPEPWTVADLIGVSRLAATDVSWMVFARLLRGQARLGAAEWDRLWPALQAGDTLPAPQLVEEAAIGLVRGSNSAAVAAAGSATGAGLIASDPHLPILLPPLWLIAGLHAPGLDAVGLMIPGLPILALGRTRHLAWGGTSLHAAGSELIDVSGEPIWERSERIAVRGRAPASITIRETRFGPVVSDGVLYRSDRPLALRWVGHAPSDEMTAMLGLLRARSLEDVRATLRGFAVPGQTMVAAEAGPNGRAGRVIAAHLPRRANGPANSLVTSPDQAWALSDLVTAADFPLVVEQIVVSANDRPPETPVPVGFFFSPKHRLRRLRALLQPPVTREQMRAAQLDVVQDGVLELRDAMLARLPVCDPTVKLIAAWDGAYDSGSRGALAFEALVAALARRLVPSAELDLLAALWTGRALVARRLTDAPPAALAAALRDAARLVRRYRSWGRVHRLRLRHPLAMLPVAGLWFTVPSAPIAGGNDTVNKSGHGFVRGRHPVTFGSCARHVSDLSDPDANWFALLGGQDGWLGSANAADQVALWQAGAAVRVPLRHDETRDWPHQTTLMPR